MKEPRSISRWIAILLGLVATLGLYGCESGGSDGNSGAQEVAVTEDEANPALNGTFSGVITVTQGGMAFDDTLALSLTVGSPLEGTLALGGGTTGTIAGEAAENTATFSGTLENCPVQDSFRKQCCRQRLPIFRDSTWQRGICPPKLLAAISLTTRRPKTTTTVFSLAMSLAMD